jgi:subtilisin family serine protease
MGPDKEILHGTHVAGIVAQVRNNNIGGDGIANNVEILLFVLFQTVTSMIKI